MYDLGELISYDIVSESGSVGSFHSWRHGRLKNGKPHVRLLFWIAGWKMHVQMRDRTDIAHQILEMRRKGFRFERFETGEGKRETMHCLM